MNPKISIYLRRIKCVVVKGLRVFVFDLSSFCTSYGVLALTDRCLFCPKDLVAPESRVMDGAA